MMAALPAALWILLACVVPSGSGCLTWEWRCNSGECIKGSARCDNQRTCEDGSDEADCPFQPDNPSATPAPCSTEEFQCRNGRCVYPGWRCDGENDCQDGSDEEFCPVHEGSVMTTASVIGLVVAVIGLLTVLSGIGVMLMCARRKMARGGLPPRRRGGCVAREDIGPYGRGFPDPLVADLVRREPPPRYSSTDNLAVVNPAYLATPPPCYSSKPDLNMVCEYVDPPPYCSHASLAVGPPGLAASRASTINSLDNPQGGGSKCDIVQTDGGSQSEQDIQVHRSVEDYKPTEESSTLYDGFTDQQKQLLDTIVAAARPTSLHLEHTTAPGPTRPSSLHLETRTDTSPKPVARGSHHRHKTTRPDIYRSVPEGISKTTALDHRRCMSASALHHRQRSYPKTEQMPKTHPIPESQEELDSSIPSPPASPRSRGSPCREETVTSSLSPTSPPGITVTAELPPTCPSDQTRKRQSTLLHVPPENQVLDASHLMESTYGESQQASEC